MTHEFSLLDPVIMTDDASFLRPSPTRNPTPRKAWFSCRKVGGIRFLRIGRLSMSFCVARH
jgi:hypothetical protein